MCNMSVSSASCYEPLIFDFENYLWHMTYHIESGLLINNQIHSHNTSTNNHMSILRVNRSKTKHCVLHNGMITWNSLPDVFKVNLSFSMSTYPFRTYPFSKSKVRKFYLEKYQEILMLEATMVTFFLPCVHLMLLKCNCFRL